MHASGAQVIVAFSIPAFTALLKLNSLKLGYNLTLVVSDVGSDPITLAGLVTAYASRAAPPSTATSSSTGSSPMRTCRLSAPSDSWYVLFKKVTTSRARRRSTAFSLRHVRRLHMRAGDAESGQQPDPGRLATAIHAGLPQGPTVAPYPYSSSDHAGITGAYMGVIKNGVLAQQGPVLVTDRSASGAITAYLGNRTAGAGDRHTVAMT